MENEGQPAVRALGVFCASARANLRRAFFSCLRFHGTLPARDDGRDKDLTTKPR
jgi:hypothetical protein